MLSFDPDALEYLEDYDASLWVDQVSDQAIYPGLCRPRHSDVEPELSAAELADLDARADRIEIERLQGMEVLLPESAPATYYPGQVPVKIDYQNGAHVAGEGSQQPPRMVQEGAIRRAGVRLSQRDDLFSPASTSLSNRLLPIVYLQHQDEDWCLVSIDVSDAYLTVRQGRLVEVVHNGAKFVLGRLLPGQRVASREWYIAFSNHLDEHLSFEKCAALPSLVRDPKHQFFMQLHVGDMLGAGSYKYLMESLKPALEIKYKVSI